MKTDAPDLPPPVDEAVSAPGPFERYVALIQRVTSRIGGSGAPLIIGSGIVFVAALLVIWRELRQSTPASLNLMFAELGWAGIIASIVFAAASYALITFNDSLALRLLGREVERAKRLAASVAGYAIARSMGYAFLTAATARMRLYTSAGLTAGETGRLSLYTGLVSQAGGATAAALGLILGAHDISTNTIIPRSLSIALGILLLAPVFVWVRAHAVADNRPTLASVLAHLLAATLAWMCAAAALYMLMPHHGGLNFPAFLACFVAATLIGALSGVPGGIGVFEAAMLAFAPRTQGAPGTAAALILWRLIFNVAPLMFAALLLGMDQASAARRVAQRRAERRKS